MILVSTKRFFIREAIKNFTRIVFFWQRHRKTLLSAAVVLAVLLVAPLIGRLTVNTDGPVMLLALILSPLVLIKLPVLLGRLEWSPVIILFVAAFVPLSLPTGTESRLVLSLLLTIIFVGVWLLKMLVEEKRIQLRRSIVNFPLFGFMASTLLALVWSFTYRDPLVIIWKSFPFVQIASGLVMIMLPCAFLLVANHVNNIKLMKIMVGIMIVAGVVGLTSHFELELPINIEGLFSMWLINLSTGLALFHKSLKWKWRILLIMLAGVWVYFRFVEQITWLAGWLPSFIALGVLVFMRSKRLLFLVVIVGAVVLALNSDYYLGTVIEAENDESGHTRLAAWEVNWRVTSRHLLLGTGPAGYAAYYMTYYANEGMATHNNYIDILAQTGIIGFVFNLWFFLALAWVSYKLCLRLKGRRDFVEALANSGFAGTVSVIFVMGFGDWLYPFAYTQTIAGYDYVVYSWLFMGTILALERLTRADEPDTEQTGLIKR